MITAAGRPIRKRGHAPSTVRGHAACDGGCAECRRRLSLNDRAKAELAAMAESGKALSWAAPAGKVAQVGLFGEKER